MMGKAISVSLILGAGFVLGPLYLAMGLLGAGYIIGEARGRAHASDMLRLGSGHVTSGRQLPAGPIETLCGFLRADREPPPIVVAYAIAESKLIGHHELARDIERTFIRGKRAESVGLASPRVFEMRETSPNQHHISENAPSPPSDSHVHAFKPPISGVDERAWQAYCAALEHKASDFENERRVGRYAARKDRLRDLGCNPDALVRHPRAVELQDAALAIDAADSMRHLDESGTVTAYVGASIDLPGGEAPATITLSGLLGVAQSAGLEGCIDWLEHEESRVRFPHTTEMFVRANGAF